MAKIKGHLVTKKQNKFADQHVVIVDKYHFSLFHFSLSSIFVCIKPIEIVSIFLEI